MQNSGGIRNDSLIAAGDIRKIDTFEMAPFSNMVAVVEGVSRQQLKEILENSVSRVHEPLRVTPIPEPGSYFHRTRDHLPASTGQLPHVPSGTRRQCFSHRLSRGWRRPNYSFAIGSTESASHRASIRFLAVGSWSKANDRRHSRFWQNPSAVIDRGSSRFNPALRSVETHCRLI
jgi:hypothetical protein